MIVAIDFFRAVPPLVLLIFVYSGLPFAGIRLSPLAAVAVAFFLNTSSYYGEIYRAGIESVGRGQWDAARSTGLSAFSTLGSRRAAAGDPQRAARPRLQHRRGGEAHLDRQRGRAARAALFRRHGALGHLQRLADRACGGDLSRHAMAGGPADQPAGTKNGIARCPACRCPRRRRPVGPDPESRIAPGRGEAPLRPARSGARDRA